MKLHLAPLKRELLRVSKAQFLRETHIFVRRASTSWVTSLTILALALPDKVAYHFWTTLTPSALHARNERETHGEPCLGERQARCTRSLRRGSCWVVGFPTSFPTSIDVAMAGDVSKGEALSKVSIMKQSQ